MYDELTIKDCQKSDDTSTNILDGVRRGFPSEEVIELLAERVLDKPVIGKFNELRDEGKTPIRLFPTRKVCEDGCWPLYPQSLWHSGVLMKLFSM